MPDFDVIIVGAGPAGIAAAAALAKAGVKSIVVLEREDELGGIPRHIHHPTFGLLVYKRPMSGPKFIGKVLTDCKGVEFRTQTSVLEIQAGGVVETTSPKGPETLSARHVILATGAREQPRHAHLVSGLRPQGITTTGALQKFIYGTKRLPFKRPVIVGTELASFSALWTLKSAGAKAVAMIEPNPRIITYLPALGFAALMGTPVHTGAEILDIGGKTQVEYITIKTAKGGEKTISCDGIIFSGNFVGETALTKQSHLKFGGVSQLPMIDQNWVSSDPNISVIGNGVHPADMGDQCYLEGLEAGQYVAQILSSAQATISDEVAITHDRKVKMTTPSMMRLPLQQNDSFDIHLHVKKPFNGTIQVMHGKEILYSKFHRCHPARRITLRKLDMNISRLSPESKINIDLQSA